MSKKTNNPTEAEIMKMVLDRIDRLDDKLEQKLNKVEDRLDTMDKTLVKQESNLEAHMKRSDLLEKSQDDLKEAVKPLLKIYTVAWGITKIVGGFAIVVGILSGIAKLMGLL